MADMKRGATVALTREIPDLTGLVLGVDYDVGAESALAEDLVLAAILCDEHGHALSDQHVVFVNQLASPDGAVARLEELLGPDDEQIEVDLAAVPAEVARIVAVLYVNDGPARHRSLARLRSCVVRVLDLSDNRELVRSENLAAGLSEDTGLSLGEVYRLNGDWKFRVLGQGYPRGMVGIAADYGIPL